MVCVRPATALLWCALLLLLIPGTAQARPAYATAEGVPCAYCHLNPGGGGPRNYRGLFYGLHMHSFVGFDDAGEAKRAGVAAGPNPERKPTSLAAAPVVAPSDAGAASVVPPITDTKGWQFIPQKTAATMAVEGDALKIVVPVHPEQYLQLAYDLPEAPADGAVLNIHLRARSDIAYSTYLIAQRSAWEEGDYAMIGLAEGVNTGPEYKEYTFTWTVRSPHPQSNKIAFAFNAPPGPDPKPTTLWIKDLTVVRAGPPPPAIADPRAVPVFGRWQDPVSRIWFVKIPAGSYVRGTTEAQRTEMTKLGLWSPQAADEMPAKSVHLNHPFMISAREVTQAEWRRVMMPVEGGRLATPSAFKGDGRPVDSVTFNDVQLFCHTLRAQAAGSGKPATYRLPTEAEWEYAARAGSDGILPLGADHVPIPPDHLKEYCWMNGAAPNATGTTGAKRPNAWGLYDMLGNVWEWCEDSYSPDAYATLPTDDPLYSSTTATERVLRGGCWFLDARAQRPAQRGGNLSTFKSPYVGLRVIRDL